MFPWHQYVLGLVFVLAGANHFRAPKVYERIIPPYIPWAKTMVALSGFAEMILGFMLLAQGTQQFGAWGIIVLLVLFVPVHIFMLCNKKASLKLPKWVLLVRIPLQFALMYWAFQYV